MNSTGIQPRPPVIAILGHVDHGKTSLLDYIRKSSITDKEHGGITQKIGAYEIETNIKGYKTNRMTFIDTPGHEAFTKLRARGSQVADIAILLIDAKDSVMPQTIESISHIKAAKIPYIVVLNKIDLPDANPEKVKNDLLKYEVLVEGKGGNVPVISVSAKKGTGVRELLEAILLISADLNLSFNLHNPLKAFIIETRKDKRGIAVSLLMRDGTLRVGYTVYAYALKAKVRSLVNDRMSPVDQIIPSTPCEMLGFEELPEVGSEVSDKPTDHENATTVPDQNKRTLTLEDILQSPSENKKLSVIVKTDSQGSLEAINHALEHQKSVEVILKAVGNISRSDVFLAKTTKSIVVGFSVHTPPEVINLAKQEKVIIKTYRIIYELLDELNEVADLMKEKEEQEKYLKGEGKVLAQFIIEGEKVFGAKIVKGKINLSDNIELFRKQNMIGKTKLVSLKIRAKAVNEVKKEQECGMVFSPQLDIQVGDVVKSIS